MFAGADELAFDKRRNERQGDQLGMGVGEGCTGAGPDVFENIDVLEAVVLVEIEEAFAVSGENIGDGGRRVGLPGLPRRPAFR